MKLSLHLTYYTVRVESESLQSEEGIVGLHNNVTGILEIRKDGVGLDELLGKMGVEVLQHKGAHARASATGN